MPSPTEEDRLIAGYAALAIAIHVLEAAFPSPIPGVKPGLANVINLVVLLRHSWRMALWVGALRVLVGSLLVGSFLSPGFWLSAAGATASLLALGLGSGWNRHLPSLALSAVGLSLLSSCAHMAAQFTLAYGWFIPHPGLLRLIPALMTAALVFGLVSGLIAVRILAHMHQLASPARAKDT